MNDKSRDLKIDGADQMDSAAAEATGGLLAHLRISVIATITLGVIVCAIYPAIVWGLSQILFGEKANGSLVRRDGTPTTSEREAAGSALIGQGFTGARYFQPRPSAAGNGYDPTTSGGSNLGPTSAKLINGTTKPAAPPAAEIAGMPTEAASAATAASPARPATQPAAVVDYDGIKLRVLLYSQANDIPVEASRPLKDFQDDKGNYDQAKLIEAFNDGSLVIRALKPIPADAVTASASGLDPHVSIENARLQAPRVAAARRMKIEAVGKLIEQFTEGPDLGIFGEPGVNVLLLNLALDRNANQ